MESVAEFALGAVGAEAAEEGRAYLGIRINIDVRVGTVFVDTHSPQKVAAHGHRLFLVGQAVR